MAPSAASGSDGVISPRPLSTFPSGALPAYVSNGVIGLRSGWPPSEPGVAILNGFSGRDPLTHVAALARAPFPLAFDAMIDGMRLSEEVGRWRLREQRYDFATGELSTELEILGEEQRVSVRRLVFCSRVTPSLCVQEI